MNIEYVACECCGKIESSLWNSLKNPTVEICDECHFHEVQEVGDEEDRYKCPYCFGRNCEYCV